MLSDAIRIFEFAWWLMLFPGIFLVLTTLAFNLLGDGLRDALDPGATADRGARHDALGTNFVRAATSIVPRAARPSANEGHMRRKDGNEEREVDLAT